ncbi:MAG: hypothetical protein CVV30_03805 [Methanomicrobiales archaeon HGW-Methanomicrobiales-1]|jgi:hypothetical protein|nr:MAG: hypothetical protein CVV30_03805 [Methanomicrobiales archaeon HGW-Methanomicrobiales-1]
MEEKNMKKIYMLLIIALFLSFLVLPVLAEKEEKGVQNGISIGAAENNGQSQGGKSDVSGAEDNRISLTQTQNIARNDQQEVRNENRNNSYTPRTISPVPGLKNQSGEEHGALLRNESTIPPGLERNQNEVREAVHALLAMENRTGGIGPQISAIARQFNNSAIASQQYEERIKNRDMFSLFFFGGDQQAAAELANLTVQNQARISEIGDLMNTTTLDADTRAQMELQIQILQQQLAQEQQLIAQAQQNKGLFGWV